MKMQLKINENEKAWNQFYVIGSGYSKINSMRKALQPYEGASDVAAKTNKYKH